MELLILGSSAAFSGKNEACSSYLLTWREKRYLIDAGAGCLLVLQNYASYADLAGIFLSHLHPDHVSDLYTLRYALYTAQREGRAAKPIPLYMPRRPRRTGRLVERTVRRECSVALLSERLRLSVDGMEVSFLRTRHPIEAYAMKFRAPGGAAGSGAGERSLVYTSDTGWFPELVEFCRGAGVLLAEATLQERDGDLEKMGHMTAERAGTLAREAGVGTLVLTHIWPEYDRSATLREARRSFEGDAFLAERGRRFTL